MKHIIFQLKYTVSSHWEIFLEKIMEAKKEEEPFLINALKC